MRKIYISDISMLLSKGAALSFREKIELAKILDKLGADCTECGGIEKVKIDSLLIKSIASAVQNAAVAVPVALSAEGVETVWSALKAAKKPRLQVAAPVSSVQMEYFYHKKPAAMLSAVKETVALCAAKGCEVEFIAEDACRAERDFLSEITAIEAGANIVTVCDTEGARLPGEIAEFVRQLFRTVPALENVRLGVKCANELSMADTASVAAIGCGAGEVKVCSCSGDTAALDNVARILAARGDSLDAFCGIRITELSRNTAQIGRMFSGKSGNPYDSGVHAEDSALVLSVHDDASAVARAVAALGYDLSEEDIAKVHDALKRIGKERIGATELDAIVATAALQVPPTYKVESYMVNSSSGMKSVAQIKLLCEDKVLQGVYAGDGPIDAAFIAVEQIVGRHFELDEFQIQAITEGREAMGETIVKLRSGGKLYSGRGISTDILGASIRAYVNALNKIVYEEGAE